MKKLIQVGARLFIVVMIGYGVGQAMETVSSLAPVQTPQPDSIVQITAEMQGLQPVAFSELPIYGTFWEVMPGGCMAPLPAPIFDSSLPIYAITDNIFLVDATGGQLAINSRQADMLSAAGGATAVVQAEATAVANLIEQVQASQAPSPLAAGPRTMTAMDSELSGPPGFGDTSTNSYSPDGMTNTFPTPDYGTNLWIASTAIGAGLLSGMGSNTIADVVYTIQVCSDLALGNWQNDGSIYGSELTNWTALSVAQNGWTNMFVRLRSEQSSDGSGLPNWWEALYFGTNSVNPDAQDSAGDGYTIYQKYALGVNPNVFFTPAAPQGLSVAENNANIAILSWYPALGPVTNYLITKYDDQTGVTTHFNVLPGTTHLSDNLSGEQPNDLGSTGPDIYVQYNAMAQYANGNSETAMVTLGFQTLLYASAVRDAQDHLNLAVDGLPTDVVGLRVYRQQDELSSISIGEDLYTGEADYFFNDTQVSDPLSDGYFNISLSDATNGLWSIPTNQVTPFGSYHFWVQGELADGTNTEWSQNTSEDWTASDDPFVDARQQLKDNLRVILRATGQFTPFTFGASVEENGLTLANMFQWATNYAYASCYCSGFRTDESLDQPFLSYSPSRPIEDNYALRNFIYDASALDEYGFLNTGIYLSSYQFPTDDVLLFLTNSPAWNFDVNTLLGTTAPTVPPSVLGTNETRWIYQLPASGSLAKNYYGLPFSSVLAITTNDYGQLVSTTYPPNASENNPLTQYYEVAQPVFTNAGYYFARPAADPMPEADGFSTTNSTPLIIQGVGTAQQIAGYDKLAVENGNSGVYGYLGQYFAESVTMTNGVATGTNSGVLSPYGNFFATEPGPVALITMPDVDPPYKQGTCTVYCVSLQFDANHDGNMDSSFNGTDATSASSPYVFWANNNYDRLLLDKDDNSFYDDDALNTSQAATCPYTPNTPTPDCNYLDGAGHRVIPCERDLQDFFRLWVCGIDTNLIAKLPAGSTVTLNWGDVGSPNTGNPTIDIFTAADPDGGIGYLTNSSTADSQIDSLYCPYIGRLAPGGSIQLNAATFANHWAGSHFIMCGVSNGTGGLNLTIADASGNVLAQSTTYLQIMDIKQMYERWTIGDQPSRAPLTNAVPATEDLPAGASAFQYTQPQDTNTSYILYVHGWNMSRYDKDRFAEAAFKRLYWQGYHGRFGSFRWPTDYDFNATLMDALFQPHNYDGSEYTAWLSAAGLLNKLKNLNSQYPGHVYVLAHSMGNVVTGEALRQAAQQGLGQIVNTYVASQAAIPAHVYDATVTSPYLIDYTHKNPSYPFSAPGHPKTPNIYGNRLTNNIAAVGHRISFYNANDYALSPDAWCFDQELKPDTFIGGYYYYAGSTNDAAPWNNFEFILLSGDPPLNLDIVNNLNDRYEALAYAANPYSRALGSTPIGTFTRGVDLSQIWPSDTVHPTHPFDEHFYHSAQFRGDYWQQQGYWSELLGSDAFNLK